VERRFHFNRDVLAGFTFIVIGAAFLWFGRDYKFGSTLLMGPGYLPTVLSCIVIGLGVVIGARGGLVEGVQLAGMPARPLVFITVAMFAFAVLIESMGLVVTGIVTMLLAAASREFNWREQAVLAVVSALVAAALFVYALRLPLKYWPSFLDAFIYS
jgi:hypothetical protein